VKVIQAVSRGRLLAAVALAVSLLSLAAYLDLQSGGRSTQLVVYVADSYSGEAASLLQRYSSEAGFQAPPVVAGGSFALAREIGAGARATVFMPVAQSALGRSYMGAEAPGFAVAIASDQLVLAFSNQSYAAAQFTPVLASLKEAQTGGSAASWREALTQLTSGGLKIGISDPRTDPAGLRGWLALESAGILYAGDRNAFTSRVVENRANVTAQNAAELVAPLEGGQIQFLFIYRSAALSHSLGYVSLPAGMNFGDPSMAQYYRSLTYDSGGLDLVGSPIYLFVAVPANTNNEGLALDFVVFCVKNSSAILSGFGMTPLKPALLFNDTALPRQISALVEEGYVTEAGPLA
jgi:molybdate/tungstate transport system substrate-binding protein